ncbi:MAG: NlpC/P60 family protein [Coriobacteriia bacterium]|nr:NlpC/P60 family protein [Coriobacteriia bacterium]
MDSMGTGIYSRLTLRGILALVLACVMLAGSVMPLYAVPDDIDAANDGQTVPISDQITVDVAPIVERPAGSETTQAETEEALELLARATPEQQVELERLFEQLDAIDRETEIAVEEHNAARMRLEQLTGNIATSEHDITLLEEAYNLQAITLSERAVEIYTGGREQILQMIFDATSPQDLIRRLEAINRFATADADLMARIRSQRSRIEATMHQLALDEGEAASLEFEMRARMIEVTGRSEDRAQELRDQNETLMELYAAEQLQRDQAERNLAAQITSGERTDISMVEGSPVETAMALRGIRYVWGGSSRAGFDCSGLVRFVFAQHGIDLPHHSGTQVLFGRRVEEGIQPNDLVFFGTPIHHVGIYVGGGYYIHAPRQGEMVSLSRLNNRSDLVAVRRLDWEPRAGSPR